MTLSISEKSYILVTDERAKSLALTDFGEKGLRMSGTVFTSDIDAAIEQISVQNKHRETMKLSPVSVYAVDETHGCILRFYNVKITENPGK